MVAGYGEDVESDSESVETDKETADSGSYDSYKDTVKKAESKEGKGNDQKQVTAPGERVSKKVLKLSAKAKQLINASETTKRARQTDFVSTPLGLRPINTGDSGKCLCIILMIIVIVSCQIKNILLQ